MLSLIESVRRKTRNVVRGLKQRYGTDRIKKSLWDDEFAQGRWACLDSMPGDFVYEHIERHANGGDVLDLGCGPGTTGTELKAGSYGNYMGVDISIVAVEKARTRAEELGRAATNQYLQSDILSYVPERPQNVILFGDSIYYIPRPLILGMLNRYAKYLTPSGVFIARIYGRKYHKIMDIIERNFEMVERHTYPKDIFVLTFRPAAAASNGSTRPREQPTAKQ
jgi:SAM-dependent methyltransferase